eukprot:m.263966 g.263966  ORF g.263966 m.263966 type:complete len:53 (+) comp40462_c0_seq5:301-459(+)
MATRKESNDRADNVRDVRWQRGLIRGWEGGQIDTRKDCPCDLYYRKSTISRE